MGATTELLTHFNAATYCADGVEEDTTSRAYGSKRIILRVENGDIPVLWYDTVSLINRLVGYWLTYTTLEESARYLCNQ